ncbi:MAG: hypothetical protein AABY47_04540 [Pseudomonadota bacterium]
MDVESMSFIFGAILIAISILGGGLEIKELKVPQVGTVSRILAAIVGVVFVTVGFSLGTTNSPNEKTPFLVPPETKPSLASKSAVEENGSSNIAFNISVSLGKYGPAEQVEETTRIMIDGSKVAEFVLDSNNPSESASINVSTPGSYRYMIEGHAVWNVTGNKRLPIYGSGTIEVLKGASFRVNAETPPSAEMQTWKLALEPE